MFSCASNGGVSSCAALEAALSDSEDDTAKTVVVETPPVVAETPVVVGTHCSRQKV